MLLFLDIDGVMVPAKSWERPMLLSDGFPAFSDQAVLALQRILTPDVTVILTTSHKSRFSIEQWKVLFNNRGLEIHHLRKLNENPLGSSRMVELINWFNLNAVVEDFIIIDDDKSLNALPPFLKERFILTSAAIGLTEAHLAEIQSILMAKTPK